MNGCEHGSWFVTTRWSVIAQAGQLGPAAAEAREVLCHTYWEPLYAYIRRHGYGPHDAQDLTQAFFVRFLGKNPFPQLDPANGKFRSFLLVSLKNFLADAHDRTNALKRQGVLRLPALDYEAAERRLAEVPTSEAFPGQSFDRHWALTVFDCALRHLAEDYEQAGNLPLYQSIKVFLMKHGSAPEYAAREEVLGMTAAAIRMAVHRLRRRFRDKVRQIVAATVSDETEIDSEMQYLVRLLCE